MAVQTHRLLHSLSAQTKAGTGLLGLNFWQNRIPQEKNSYYPPSPCSRAPPHCVPPFRLRMVYGTMVTKCQPAATESSSQVAPRSTTRSQDPLLLLFQNALFWGSFFSRLHQPASKRAARPEDSYQNCSLVGESRYRKTCRFISNQTRQRGTEITAGRELPAVECMFKANRFCTAACKDCTYSSNARTRPQAEAAGASARVTRAPKTQLSRSSESRNFKTRQ